MSVTRSYSGTREDSKLTSPISNLNYQTVGKTPCLDKIGEFESCRKDALGNITKNKPLNEKREVMWVNSENSINIPKYHAFCATLCCRVINPVNGKSIKVRVLLDSVANLSMIESKTAKALGLKEESVNIDIAVAGGAVNSYRERQVVFSLANLKSSACTAPVVAITCEEIGNSLEPICFNPQKWDYTKDIKFAEELPSLRVRNFQILLSEPYYSAIMLNEERKILLPSGETDMTFPVAKLTILGWILSGADGISERITVGKDKASMYSGVVTQIRKYEDFDLDTVYRSLEFNLVKFWDGENVGINSKEPITAELTSMELQADLHMLRTSVFDKSKNKWFIKLPWIDTDPKGRVLSDNYARAIAVMHRVHHKVKPEHMNLVTEAYEEFLDLGYAEEVPSSERFTEHPSYVITSRSVFHLDKESTKCRIVVNASLPDVKDKTKSLNKLLMPGKNMLPQIMELILKVKCEKYFVAVDIKKMFLSINLADPRDKDMFRFVWGRPGYQPKLMRFKVVVFGLVSAPYISMWCLKETAKKVSKEYPIASEVIDKMTYMDDIHIIQDTSEDVIQTTLDVLKILERGGFYGHKIASSHPEILSRIEPERVAPPRSEMSVLGLKLDTNTDEFKFDPDSDSLSRRDIVSLANQVFDTQGYVSPFVMQFKQILPLLWEDKLKWDENLKSKDTKAAKEAVKVFIKWVNQIPLLKDLRFPRYNGGSIKRLAVLGDASKIGMGVAAYLVTQSEVGKLQSHLVYSKSSLMPKALREKSKLEDILTIARAELIALTMAISMANYIQDTLKPMVCPENTVIFTDSVEFATDTKRKRRL